jgi:hypothetical protein
MFRDIRQREPRNRPRRTHTVSGGISQLFLNLGTRRGVCGQHHAPVAFTPGKDPVPLVQEAGWATEPVWIDAENLAPLGFDPRPFKPVASRYTDYLIPAPVRDRNAVYCKEHEQYTDTVWAKLAIAECYRWYI